VAKNKKSTPTKTPAPVKPGGLEFYFDKYAAAHQNPVNKIIQIIAVPLFMFSVFILAWCIKFPYIKFLGQYNQDFNWASFLLAFSIYYYMRLSPVLSYFLLFILLGFFYIITEMVQWQNAGGPYLATIGLGIYCITGIALFIGYKLEGKKLSFEYRLKNSLIAPLYLLHLMLRRFSIKY
jgi:uncharacterized membrane protein YGL010W